MASSTCTEEGATGVSAREPSIDVVLNWSADDALTMQSQALQVVDHGVVLVNETAGVARVNPIAGRLLGLSSGPCHVRAFYAALGSLRQRARDAQSLAAHWSQLVRSPSFRVSKWLWQFADPTMHLHISTSPVTVDNARGRVWVVSDVSHFFKALSGAAKLERQLESFLTDGDVIAFRIRRGDILEWISPSIRRMMGFDPKMLSGGKAIDICHPDDAPSFSSTIRRLQATGTPQPIGFRIVDIRGAVRTLDGRMVLAKDGSDGVDVILSDVSSHVEHERIRDLMLTSALHEFKTPLAFLAAGLAMIDDGTVTPSDAQGREVVERMYSASMRLARMSDSLLGLHNMEVTRTAVGTESTQIANCVSRAVHTVPVQRGVCVALQDGTNGACKRVDEDLLEQAVINLVDNAVRHSPDGGVIDVVVACDAGSITVSVRDRGAGVPIDAREEVFQPFVRLVRDRVGAGLGLAIVRRVADLHRGSVTIQTPHDKVGSVFVLILNELG